MQLVLELIFEAKPAGQLLQRFNSVVLANIPVAHFLQEL